MRGLLLRTEKGVPVPAHACRRSFFAPPAHLRFQYYATLATAGQGNPLIPTIVFPNDQDPPTGIRRIPSAEELRKITAGRERLWLVVQLNSFDATQSMWAVPSIRRALEESFEPEPEAKVGSFFIWRLVRRHTSFRAKTGVHVIARTDDSGQTTLVAGPAPCEYRSRQADRSAQSRRLRMGAPRACCRQRVHSCSIVRVADDEVVTSRVRHTPP